MVGKFLLAATAVMALGACAATETASSDAAPRGDCFRTATVNGYEPIDDRHVRVTVSANRHYTLTTNTNVSNLNWTQQVALHSRTGWVCTGSSIPDLEVIGGNPVWRHQVTEVTRDPEPAPAQQGS